ncbi:MAG: hypothetical protein LBJ35_08155 [Spirochaetaceae bacterium]|jgi:hypothetical protein|nr:hypothetical protein [Spirochaetaceae bacterium]
MTVIRTQAEYDAAYKAGERKFEVMDAAEIIAFSGNSHAMLNGDSHVVLNDHSMAVLNGNSHAVLRGDSHAVLNGDSHAVLRGNSRVVLNGNSSAERVSEDALIEDHTG